MWLLILVIRGTIDELGVLVCIYLHMYVYVMQMHGSFHCVIG